MTIDEGVQLIVDVAQSLGGVQTVADFGKGSLGEVEKACLVAWSSTSQSLDDICWN